MEASRPDRPKPTLPTRTTPPCRVCKYPLVASDDECPRCVCEQEGRSLDPYAHLYHNADAALARAA